MHVTWRQDINIFKSILWFNHLGTNRQHGLVERVSLIGVVCEAVVSEHDGVLKPAAHWKGVPDHCPLHTWTCTHKHNVPVFQNPKLNVYWNIVKVLRLILKGWECNISKFLKRPNDIKWAHCNWNWNGVTFLTYVPWGTPLLTFPLLSLPANCGNLQLDIPLPASSELFFLKTHTVTLI